MAKRYNPYIGNLVVEFLDYFSSQSDPRPGHVLRIFKGQRNLDPRVVYQIALLLREQGYAIDPVEFHPEYFSESVTDNAFDAYDDALRGARYREAHQIYENMTPTEKQILRDRRGAMKKNELKRLAQDADTEATIEKEVPAEGAGAPMDGMAQLLEAADWFVENHQTMNLPIQSMQVFMPFAHSLDEFRRAQASDNPEELAQRTQAFLDVYEKLLTYLDQEGWDTDELLGLVQQQRGTVQAKASHRLFALACKLQERGMTDVATKLLRTIRAQMQEGETEIIPPGTVEQAEAIINDPDLSEFVNLLQTEKWSAAREKYLQLPPNKRKLADNIAKQHFAAVKLLTLHRIGEDLFRRGRYTEAAEVSRVVKAQFMELSPEMQGEIVLILVPEGEELPQAFQAQQDQEREMHRRMRDMQRRLNRETGQCPHMLIPSAQLINRLVRLADHLDARGCSDVSDRIGTWMEGLKAQAQGWTPPTLTPQQIEEVTSPLEKGYTAEDIEKYKMQPLEKGEQRVGKRDIGVAQCTQCGGDIFYDRAQGAPRYCPQCGKEKTWTHTSREAQSKKDKLPGGLADDKPSDKAYDPRQLEMGRKVEMEHTDDEELAKEIAKDHLVEIPKGYYDALKKMEKDLKDKEAASSCPMMKKKKKTKKTEKKSAVKCPVCGHVNCGCGCDPKTGKGCNCPQKKEAKSARDKYVSEEGHFKGREGTGERWDNCIKYQMSQGKSRESAEKICGYIKSRKGCREELIKKIGEEKKKDKKDDHGGKPEKVVEIADAIRRDNPGTSDEAAYRMAWETYCSYTNPSHPGCTEKGKSKRKSPKPYEKSSSVKQAQDALAIPSPHEVMSLLATKDGHLKQIDEVLGDLPAGVAEKLKLDLVDHLEKKFLAEHSQGAEVGVIPEDYAENWEKYFKNFVVDDGMIEGSSFEKALHDRLAQRFGGAEHDIVEDQMPGEVPGAEELQDWYKESASKFWKRAAKK